MSSSLVSNVLRDSVCLHLKAGYQLLFWNLVSRHVELPEAGLDQAAVCFVLHFYLPRACLDSDTNLPHGLTQLFRNSVYSLDWESLIQSVRWR